MKPTTLLLTTALLTSCYKEAPIANISLGAEDTAQNTNIDDHRSDSVKNIETHSKHSAEEVTNCLRNHGVSFDSCYVPMDKAAECERKAELKAIVEAPYPSCKEAALFESQRIDDISYNEKKTDCLSEIDGNDPNALPKAMAKCDYKAKILQCLLPLAKDIVCTEAEYKENPNIKLPPSVRP